jgi:hypothetical protein
VESDLVDPFDVPALLIRCDRRCRKRALTLVEGDRKLELLRLVADDVDRVDRFVQPFRNADEPDEWQPVREGPTERAVLWWWSRLSPRYL